MVKFKVRWRSLKGDWFVVDESNGEVHAKAERQENGLWLATVVPVLRNTYWDAPYAIRAVEENLDMDGKAEYEFVSGE